jgi:ketosteroid isomerase-like protein
MSTEPDESSIERLPAADQAAILTTLGALSAAFEHRDAEVLEGAYSDDADWVNAFGTVKKGGPAIVAYLRGLFADANGGRSRAEPPARRTCRRLQEVP